MKESGKKLKKRAGYFIVAVLLALILHIGPLFIFHPYQPDADEQTDNGHFMVMVNSTKHTDLDYWLRSMRPNLIARPDPLLGYTATTLNRKDPLLSDSNPVFPSLTTENPAKEKLSPERKPEDLASPEIALPMPVIRKKQAVSKTQKQPCVMMIGNQVFQGKIEGKTRSDELPIQAALIRVEKPEDPLLPPKVTLQQSCGYPRLDLLALRAAASAAVHFTKEELRRPACISVDWRPAPKEKKKQ